MLSADYEAEQESLEADMTELKKNIEAYNVDMDNTKQFIEIAEKYTDFSVLTAPMLNEFIEKIVVHSPEWNDVPLLAVSQAPWPFYAPYIFFCILCP